MRALLVLLLFGSFSLSAQKIQKKSIPNGFEWISKRDLIVSTNETSCSDWLKFLEANERDVGLLPVTNELVLKCIYTKKGEAVMWRTAQSIFRDTTFLDPEKGPGKKTRSVEKCSNMPVTGITFEQANAYCEWLSDKYADDSKYARLKLNFRLPTPMEMDSLLQDVFSLWRKGEDSYAAFQQGTNGHGCAIYNHRHDSWCDTNLRMKSEFGYGIPMQSGVFFADANGLYDLMGNVAEMTSEKGIAKGGSCLSAASECQPGTVNRYEAPQPWLGFRVVARLKQ